MLSYFYNCNFESLSLCSTGFRFLGRIFCRSLNIFSPDSWTAKESYMLVRKRRDVAKKVGTYIDYTCVYRTNHV